MLVSAVVKSGLQAKYTVHVPSCSSCSRQYRNPDTPQQTPLDRWRVQGALFGRALIEVFSRERIFRSFLVHYRKHPSQWCVCN